MKDPIELALGVGTLLMSGVGILGQTGILDTGHSFLTQYGGIGLATWLVIHHTMKTIPGMETRHQTERLSFQQILADERKEHAAEMERQRAQFADLMSRHQCRWKEEA